MCMPLSTVAAGLRWQAMTIPPHPAGRPVRRPLGRTRGLVRHRGARAARRSIPPATTCSRSRSLGPARGSKPRARRKRSQPGRDALPDALEADGPPLDLAPGARGRRREPGRRAAAAARPARRGRHGAGSARGARGALRGLGRARFGGRDGQGGGQGAARRQRASRRGLAHRSATSSAPPPPRPTLAEPSACRSSSSPPTWAAPSACRKATTVDELDAALDEAFGYDEVAVVEEAVTGREIEVAVLGDDAPARRCPARSCRATSSTTTTTSTWSTARRLLIPAPLDDRRADEVRELALDAFRALRLHGHGPASTSSTSEAGAASSSTRSTRSRGSRRSRCIRSCGRPRGVGYAELIDELVRLALERHTRQSRYR